MSTYIATGKDLTLTVNGVDVSPQASTVELTYENQIETYKTLTGTTKKKTGTDGNLTISVFQDWDATSSFCVALWNAAQTGTPVAFTFTADGHVFTGNVVPQYPKVGGAADAALESSITLPISGDVLLDD